MPMIADMHKYGIRLDCALLNSMTLELRTGQREIESAIAQSIGAYQYRTGPGALIPFNVGSPDHVSQLLFEYLQVQKSESVPMTPKAKRFTTDDGTLGRFRKRHPVVQMVLDWRELDKFAGTYTEPLVKLVDANGFLHPRFNTTVVATGRLSIGYLQTLPARSKLGKRIRNAIIAPPGCLLVNCDLSQIEMRLAAHLSQDPSMMEVFWNGGDIHVKTACRTFDRDYAAVLPMYLAYDSGNRECLTPDEIAFCKSFKQDERLPSKTTGFGTLYEQTDVGLQTQLLDAISSAQPDRDPDEILAEWPVEKCAGMIQGFYDEYRMLRPYQDKQHTRTTRYAMNWDPFGRVRLVPEARSAIKKIKMEGWRKSSNHPIQGGAQGVIKLAMAEVNPIMRQTHAKGIWCTPALQNHDAILGIVDKRIAEEFANTAMRPVMEHACPLDVPVLSSAEVGERWGEMG